MEENKWQNKVLSVLSYVREKKAQKEKKGDFELAAVYIPPARQCKHCQKHDHHTLIMSSNVKEG